MLCNNNVSIFFIFSKLSLNKLILTSTAKANKTLRKRSNVTDELQGNNSINSSNSPL